MQIRCLLPLLSALIIFTGCHTVGRGAAQTQLQFDVEALRARAEYTIPRNTLDDWKLGFPKFKYDPYIVNRWEYYPWLEDVSGEWLLDYMDRETRYYAIKKDMTKWEETREPWVPKPSKYDKLLEKAGIK
jgi:hypothetical protein